MHFFPSLSCFLTTKISEVSMEYLQYSPFFLTKGTSLRTSTGWNADQTLYVWQIYLYIHISYIYIRQRGYPVHFGNKTWEGTQQSTFIRKSDRENVSETERHTDRPRERSTNRSISCHLGTCWLPCRTAFLVPVSTKPRAWAAHPLQSFRVPATDGERKDGQQRLRICLRKATRRDRARAQAGTATCTRCGSRPASVPCVQGRQGGCTHFPAARTAQPWDPRCKQQQGAAPLCPPRPPLPSCTTAHGSRPSGDCSGTASPAFPRPIGQPLCRWSLTHHAH